MNYKFSVDSVAELETCHHVLRNIAFKVLEIKDHSILKGHRTEDEQDAAFTANPPTTKLQWPAGKHNQLPSHAMDVQTYPRPPHGADFREDQMYLLGLYVGVAHYMGVDLRTGADWDDDGEVSDNGWDDLFHVEIPNAQG